MSDRSSSTQIGVISILGLIFITLKLLHVITWSWWWVLSPFWGGFLLFILIMFILVVVKAAMD